MYNFSVAIGITYLADDDDDGEVGGRAASTCWGVWPVTHVLTYRINRLTLPHDSPATTPASTTFLHGYGSRLTAATTIAIPILTPQLTAFRRFVAWKSPIEYNGARKKWYQRVPFFPGMRVKLRFTTIGLNLSWKPLYPSTYANQRQVAT
jgi:hypothetical protein